MLPLILWLYISLFPTKLNIYTFSEYTLEKKKKKQANYIWSIYSKISIKKICPPPLTGFETVCLFWSGETTVGPTVILELVSIKRKTQVWTLLKSTSPYLNNLLILIKNVSARCIFMPPSKITCTRSDSCFTFKRGRQFWSLWEGIFSFKFSHGQAGQYILHLIKKVKKNILCSNMYIH